MVEDKELIRKYAAEGSEMAFAELVRRHLSMVYGAALRQVNGDAHLAQDLAQSVFSDLAARAATLQDATSIAGWLYTNTRFAAVKAVRAEARRRAREQAAASMNEMNAKTNEVWNELRPMIDEALSELAETDREAIVLRYFEASEFSLVGAALGVSENAARMRVERALEKLRAVLQKHGLTTASAVLAGVLADSSAATVPVQLAASITGAALICTATPAAPSILQLMAMKSLLMTVSGLLAVSLAVVLVVRQRSVKPPLASVTARPDNASSSLSQPDAPEPFLNIPKGEYDFSRKLAQRRDEQVRAREVQPVDQRRAEWDKKVADFDDSLKEETGVKKSGAKIQATFAPGETLVASGWRTVNGNNCLVFVRQQINPELEGVRTVLISPLLIEAPDEVLDRLGMAAFKAKPDGSNPQAMFSSEQADQMFNSITNTTGGLVFGSPKIVQGFGQEGNVSVGSVTSIDGNQQFLGLQISFFPSIAADGSSLDLGMLVRSTLARAAEDGPTGGQ
jgi:RNA polymerase sigma factor (sigma-70 family)